jgi:hypothetical protein
MFDVIQLVHDYRVLVGREALRLRPREHDIEKLQALDRLFAQRARDAGDRRRHKRYALNVKAFLRAASREASGEIIDLSAGGCVVKARMTAAGVGGEVLIKIATDTRTFQFPARVMWRREQAIGVQFEGVPVEIRVGPSFSPQAPARAA